VKAPGPANKIAKVNLFRRFLNLETVKSALRLLLAANLDKENALSTKTVWVPGLAAQAHVSERLPRPFLNLEMAKSALRLIQKLAASLEKENVPSTKTAKAPGPANRIAKVFLNRRFLNLETAKSALR